MVRLFSQRWLQVFLLLLLLAGIVAVKFSDPPAIVRLRHLTFDYYNKLMPRQPGSDTVIIDIDEESLKRLGQWPWPRTTVAALVTRLRALGARVIAFDMAFAEPDRTSPSRIADSLPHDVKMQPVIKALKGLPDNDDLFAQTIAAAGNVVTAFVEARQPTEQLPVSKAQITYPDLKRLSDRGLRVSAIPKSPFFAATRREIAEASAGSGAFISRPEQDGIIRRVPLLAAYEAADGTVSVYPALSVEALRVLQGADLVKVNGFKDSEGSQSEGVVGIMSVTVGQYTLPTDQNGNIWVHYAGHREGLYIPAWQVLEGKVPEKTIQNKVVFVGTSAIGLLDIRSTPLDPIIPGVEIHAEIVEQALSGDFLLRQAYFNYFEMAFIAASSLLIIFLAPFISVGMLAFVSVLLIGGSNVGALYLYQRHGLLFDPVYPALATLVIFILSSILSNLRTEMQRRADRKALSHYISPALMEELSRDPEKLRLGGEVRELTVMFTDIRNFTAISESMDPAELIRTMNDFLTPMTARVLDSRGTVDKYMGDAMMAFWNAPLDDPDHARHACAAALGMRAALAPVNEVLRLRAAQGERPFRELRAGIGIHTGRCAVGNMGSRQRFAYSALGDTVNLASRLEGQTKAYGAAIIISAETRRQAPDFAAVELDVLAVKGRQAPERVYALLGDAALAAEGRFCDFARRHEEMLAAYRARAWERAEALAEQCRQLQPELEGFYAVFRQRLAAFRQTPPPADWQGVWVAAEK